MSVFSSVSSWPLQGEPDIEELDHHYHLNLNNSTYIKRIKIEPISCAEVFDAVVCEFTKA